MSEAEIIRAGREAQELSQHPLVIAAFDAVERKILDLWQSTKLGDRDKREEAYFALNGLRLFRTEFVDAITNGKMAEHNAKRRQAEEETFLTSR